MTITTLLWLKTDTGCTHLAVIMNVFAGQERTNLGCSFTSHLTRGEESFTMSQKLYNVDHCPQLETVRYQNSGNL
jgi:hypothetical protein